KPSVSPKAFPSAENPAASSDAPDRSPSELHSPDRGPPQSPASTISCNSPNLTRCADIEARPPTRTHPYTSAKAPPDTHKGKGSPATQPAWAAAARLYPLSARNPLARTSDAAPHAAH